MPFPRRFIWCHPSTSEVLNPLTRRLIFESSTGRAVSPLTRQQALVAGKSDGKMHRNGLNSRGFLVFFFEWFFLRLVNFLGFLETLLHEQIMQKGCPKLENNGEIPYWKIEGEHTTGQIQHTFKNSTCGKHGIIILTIERRNIASCNLKLWRKTKKIVYYSILWK